MTYADLAAAVKTGTLKPEGPEMAFAPSQLRHAIWQAYQGDLGSSQSVHDYMLPEWDWCVSCAPSKPLALVSLYLGEVFEVSATNALASRAWLEAVFEVRHALTSG